MERASPTSSETFSNDVIAERAFDRELRDLDGIYRQEFLHRARSLGMIELKIAPRSPWQNPYAEQMIGILRRECLDHMIIFNERSGL